VFVVKANKQGRNSLRISKEKAVAAVIRRSHAEDTKSRLRYMLGAGRRMQYYLIKLLSDGDGVAVPE
jgi:hypothetical protein